MPPTTPLGRAIRQARLTYWMRVADRLQAELNKLDHDPEVTTEGPYLCWEGKRVHCPPAVDLVRKYGTELRDTKEDRQPVPLEGGRSGAGPEG